MDDFRYDIGFHIIYYSIRIRVDIVMDLVGIYMCDKQFTFV